jgi:hypothetical protein
MICCGTARDKFTHVGVRTKEAGVVRCCLCGLTTQLVSQRFLKHRREVEHCVNAARECRRIRAQLTLVLLLPQGHVERVLVGWGCRRRLYP